VTQLRELREAAGVPQIELARRCGISRFRIYEAEFGMRELTAEELQAIQRVLAPEFAKQVRAAAQFQTKGIANA